MKKLTLMSQVKWAIILLACLFLLAGAANATMIFDNLGASYGGYDPLAGWTEPGYGMQLPPLFDSFSVGAAGFNLLDVQLKLRGTPDSGSFSVAIYSNSSNKPGKLLFNIATRSDHVLTSTWSVVEFLLASPLKLTAGRYWVELNPINGSSAEWSWTPDQGTLGEKGEYCGHGPWVYPDSNGPYQIRLKDTPLPHSLLLLGSGLACLGLWRGKKLFKA